MGKLKVKKNTQVKNYDKLKTLKELRTCMVVLHNIALDKDLVQRYQLLLSGKEREHSPSCTNTSKNSSNVWMLKENMLEDNSIEGETPRLTRSRSKKLERALEKTGKSNESKNLKFLDDTLYNHYEIIQPGAQKQQLKHDSSIKSLLNKSNDETSSASSLMFCSHMQEKTVPINNKKRCSNKRPNIQKKSRLGYKRKLDFDESEPNKKSTPKTSSNGENYLDEENIAVIDYNRKMQEISSESIKKNIIQYNKNIYSTITKVCEVRLDCEKNQAMVNKINTDVKNKISGTSNDIKTDFKFKNANCSNSAFTVYHSINRNQDQEDAKTKGVSKPFDFDLKSMYQTMPKTNHVTDTHVTILPDFRTTCNTKHVNNKINKKITKSLPKITGDHILPKGTIKIMKVNTGDNSLQSKVSEQALEQNRYDTNSNMKQISHIDDTLESTNILREKEYHASEINGSTDTLKISKSTSALNNNINLKNKNINNNELHNSKNDRKNVDSSKEIRNNIHNNVNINDADSETMETMETYENYILNHQGQSKSDNDEEHENNILQGDKKCDETNSDENILNKNISNFMNVSESCNVSRLSVSKEEAIKRKRIAEENTIDIKLDNKKRKLNRTTWLQNNVTCAKSLNHRQFNNFLNIDTTVESNMSEENNPEQGTDLREHLNQKRSKSPKPSIFENKNNRNSTEKQINLTNKNDIITPTNVAKNEKFRKRLSFEKEPTFTKPLCKEKDLQTDPVCNNHMHCHSTLQSTSEKTQHINEIDKGIHKNTNIQEKQQNSRNEDDDDDCISLYAESFDTNFCENTFLKERDEPKKFLHSDVPYIMTASSFNKYVRQNATEFNKEYAQYAENSIEMSNKTDKTRKEFNNLGQTIPSDCVPETRTASKLIPQIRNEEIPRYPWSQKINFNNFCHGYCFCVLKKGICYKQLSCRYKHDLQCLINTVCSEDLKTMPDIIQEMLLLGYNFFCKAIYTNSLQKLTVDQILIIYQMIHDVRNLRDDFPSLLKKHMMQDIVKELMNRQMSLNTIVNCLVEYIGPTTNVGNLMNLLTCVETYIKRGEYWNTVRTLILRLPPVKHIIHKILLECIENEKSIDIQEVNNNLINKLSPLLISTLDKNIMERFKSLWAEKTARSSHSAVLVQNFGENLTETIASPDGSTNLSQTESPRRDSTFINKNANKVKDHVTEVNGEAYVIRPIDDLSNARSVYRDHEHLWKFYVDLERFKKGLQHQDYDYVINILKNYAEKQGDSSLFVRSCCSILRTEVKRSEYHLANIIRRTVQMGTFDILGKILFDIGLDILTSLVDQEAWGLALWLIQSLKIHNLPCNAEYFLLSAEIYLANKKAVKACDLLKYKNIICTSRQKWYVNSTINDEHVRSKIIYILLDSFCNEFVEHAFFLFQFLLKDQCSQYYPIDLSRYVDKLIILSLSKKDTNLITEMANLILKYTFALSTTTCRALISTLIHTDENLARQMYNYAEHIGIYPAVKLWPVTYIIINTNLTEEEIYLTFLQLLKNLVINLGHAIEFVKFQQIKVYLILEIKSINEQFYCAELQNYYNNKAITNIKVLVRNVLKKRFDPPILLTPGSKGRIYKLQSKSLMNYLKTEHCT